MKLLTFNTPGTAGSINRPLQDCSFFVRSSDQTRPAAKKQPCDIFYYYTKVISIFRNFRHILVNIVLQWLKDKVILLVKRSI